MSKIKLRQTQAEVIRVYGVCARIVARWIGRQSKGERHGMFDRRY